MNTNVLMDPILSKMAVSYSDVFFQCSNIYKALLLKIEIGEHHCNIVLGHHPFQSDIRNDSDYLYKYFTVLTKVYHFNANYGEKRASLITYQYNEQYIYNDLLIIDLLDSFIHIQVM